MSGRYDYIPADSSAGVVLLMKANGRIPITPPTPPVAGFKRL